MTHRLRPFAFVFGSIGFAVSVAMAIALAVEAPALSKYRNIELPRSAARSMLALEANALCKAKPNPIDCFTSASWRSLRRQYATVHDLRSLIDAKAISWANFDTSETASLEFAKAYAYADPLESSLGGLLLFEDIRKAQDAALASGFPEKAKSLASLAQAHLPRSSYAALRDLHSARQAESNASWTLSISQISLISKANSFGDEPFSGPMQALLARMAGSYHSTQHLNASSAESNLWAAGPDALDLLERARSAYDPDAPHDEQ